MKKSLIFLLFLLFFNGSFFTPTLDTENIKLDIKRLENEKILVEWSINFEDYDDIVLQISHDNNIETSLNLFMKGKKENITFPPR